MAAVTQLHPEGSHATAVAARAGLIDLARDRSPDARQRLLMGVAALCDSQPPGIALSPVLADIFLTLARQAERDIRKALAVRLAEADWAPRALVAELSLDEIEIARPILTSSPVLQDEDLLRVLIEATLDHQIAVARRPNLTARVADAIVARGEPAILTALASNATAQIGGESLRDLIAHSRRVAALRSPLSRHPALTDELAADLYQWVGDALRQAITARFSLPAHRLQPVLADAVRAAADRSMSLDERVEDPDQSEERLISKLKTSGQLRAGYLIRAVRERRLGLFSHGLAALSGLTPADIRRALDADTPEALFYACAAVGIDRAVFPALLTEVRLLHDGSPGAGGERVWRKGDVSPIEALRAFRAALPLA